MKVSSHWAKENLVVGSANGKGEGGGERKGGEAEEPAVIRGGMPLQHDLSSDI
jgi:hypothetical protein